MKSKNIQFQYYYNIKFLKYAIKLYNLKNNIHILSILCKNMPYLNQEYPEFLSKYYSEMNLFIDYSNSSMIHNNLQHLYSFCEEFKIMKITFVIYFFHPLYNSIFPYLL